MGRYEDFRWATSRALDFALASTGIRLPDGQVLSNGTPAMIANCLGNSGLGDFFGRRISVDEVRSSRRLWCTGTRPGGCPGRSGRSGS